MFGWLKQRRRAKLLAKSFPLHWDEIIRSNVVHDRHLSAEQQARLRRLMQVFIPEKNWEGCGGLSVTDEMKVTIAAQACLLVVGMNREVLFDHVLSILIYPTSYVAAGTQISQSGLVTEGGQARLGEAWWKGPVVLSWAEAQAGGVMETPGRNLVLHEFAHQLDMMNGRICDGTPELESREKFERWLRSLGPEFEQLVESCQHRHHGFIDCYGATNPAEFFAVLTETFFERPTAFHVHHQDAYDVLRDFYQLDPASWSNQTH